MSSYAKGFVKGKDLKSNARFHRSQKVLVNLDIKDFFPSISIYDVCNIFYEMGYSKKLSMFLSHLCCYHECLPQGAPTSPYLSNLMMRSFDNEITELIQTYKIRYTRYADDITVSGDFEPSTIIHYINKTLYKYGFRLNKNKTRVCRKNARQEVTGIVVNSYMQASKERRKKIRQEVYYIKKYGLESHLSHTKETRAHYLNNLLGRIGYVLYVNPKDNEMFGYYSYIMNLLMELKKS